MNSSPIFSPIPYRNIIVSIYVLVAVVSAVSMSVSVREIDSDIANIARERGSVLFRLIELTRDWSARHGGVYVPVTEATQPNPYLKHPKRDIIDNHGRELTLINPAFMTRQIAEIATQVEGVRFHITSLKPIRPANEADSWEKETLELFEKRGAKDRLQFFADGGGIIPGPAHRYMAPLIVKQACMNCHEFQGYQVGDIRGGISITLPADKLVEIAAQRRKQVMGLYLAAAILVAGLGHLVAWRTHRYTQVLEDINRAQEVVIEKSTLELSEAEKEQLIAAAVFGNAAEAIMVTDKNNKIIRINPAFTAITGYTPAEVIGHDPHILKSGRHDKAYFDEMWRSLNEIGRWEGEIWNRRKNGETYVEWLAITTIPGEAGQGRHVATFIDISKRKEAEEIILHKANFDALTNLPNRGLFDDRLDSALATARRHQRSIALMYIDLDKFKAVNDTLGHAAGDALLAEAAARMEMCVRDADTVARLGGDEFAIILADLNHAGEAEEVARRINHALAEPFDLPDGRPHISGSIGIAIFPQDGHDESLLKKSADQALYAAKAAGRNTYRLAALMP